MEKRRRELEFLFRAHTGEARAAEKMREAAFYPPPQAGLPDVTISSRFSNGSSHRCGFNELLLNCKSVRLDLALRWIGIFHFCPS